MVHSCSDRKSLHLSWPRTAGTRRVRGSRGARSPLEPPRPATEPPHADPVKIRGRVRCCALRRITTSDPK